MIQKYHMMLNGYEGLKMPNKQVSNDIASDDFFSFLLHKASELRSNAGYSGMHTDGGASELEAQIKCYWAGVEGKMPNIWELYHTEYKKVSDIEYTEYLRLKKKFDE